LLQFYKFAAKAHQGSKNIFANWTLERLKPHNHTLSLRKTPQKEFKSRIAALGPSGWRGRPNSGELAGGLCRGSG
jgi:hypothetical protein